MQYLIRHITDSTNHTFVEVIKPRENETFIVVDAESAEEAKEKVKKPRGLTDYVPSSFNSGPVGRALSKTNKYKKDSE